MNLISDETGHKYSLIKLRHYEAAFIDCAIQPLVVWMNEIELYTQQSCQGDPYDFQDKNAYVTFYANEEGLCELLLVLRAFAENLDDEPWYIAIDLCPSNCVRYTLRFVSRSEQYMTGYDYMQAFQNYLREIGEISE